jgi:hypothetical protein
MKSTERLPDHWLPKDPRIPEIRLAHVLDDVFELVMAGATRADAIAGHDEYPDLYPIMRPIELGKALIEAGNHMLNLTQTDTRSN